MEIITKKTPTVKSSQCNNECKVSKILTSEIKNLFVLKESGKVS